MPAPLTLPELLQLRMRAQLLWRDAPVPAPDLGQPGGAPAVAAVARHMLALQGQDWPSSRWALGVRAPGARLGDVHAAFDQGLLVRSWPMRGTVHVVAAEDIGWLQALTNARVLRGAVKRREFLGIDDATLDRVVEVSLAALAGGSRLTREALSATWTAAGITWQSNWRYHLVWWLCQTGLAVLGPVSRVAAGQETTVGEPLIVLAEDWVTAPRQLSGDEALRELATRYAGARGPVTAKDLAWWAGLTMGESKRGFALATEAGSLRQVEIADRPAPHWCATKLLGWARNGEQSGQQSDQQSGAVGSSPEPHAALLLPAFDEHLLGYTDRTAQLDPAHVDRIVPGRNGVFRATVVSGSAGVGGTAPGGTAPGGTAPGGVVQGTWRRDGPGASSAHLVASPMPGCEIRASALTCAVDGWARFHDCPGATLEVG